MKEVELYAFGRTTVEGQWEIDQSRIVNRLYHVNRGSAVILNGSSEYRLTEGKSYIIPQCKNFSPISAERFDHTYFDFYHASILHPKSIVEIGEDAPHAKGFFSLVNGLIESGAPKEAMEDFLRGFLTLTNEVYMPLPFLGSPALTEAIRIIHKEYPTVTTRSLSVALNLNESFFIRSFSAAMGISPMKYIRAIRVSYGRAFIRSGMSITLAAEKCGYSSPSSFYNAMIAELGKAPSEFKKA